VSKEVHILTFSGLDISSLRRHVLLLLLRFILGPLGGLLPAHDNTDREVQTGTGTGTGTGTHNPQCLNGRRQIPVFHCFNRAATVTCCSISHRSYQQLV
jgi:hypothetical protein